jgi:glycerophosphoryl diester phosphodiesterase
MLMQEETVMRMIKTIAHRGFAAVAPENTLAAFRKALEHLPDMIECDVWRTKDVGIVVIHDPDVDRTTNGHGLVADMTVADLKKLDAGSWFHPAFAGEQIPTLEETLDLVKGSGVTLVIEVKEEGIEDQVVAAVQERGMSSQVRFTTDLYSVGMRLPALDPDIQFTPTINYPGKIDDETAVLLADEAASVNGTIFGVNYTAITPPLVDAVHAANMQLMAWTVDREEDIRVMADIGVDVITSNDIELLNRVLSAIGQSAL